MNPQESVAVVGIGGIFAQSFSPERLWSAISGARDTSGEIPPGRWLLPPEAIFDPSIGAADRVYCTRGYFIEGFRLDPTGMAVADVNALDHAFHLALHAGRAAWKDAVTAPLDRERVGVILGSIALPTDRASQIAGEILGPHPSGLPVDPRNCHPTGLPAIVLAEALGLRGGAYTIDAACASSLYAIKQAMDDLISGRKDAMLAGGVSRPDCLYTQMGFSQLRVLAPSGRCAPLDAAGDGLVVGEGAAVFVLKRLADAVAHGDTTYGVLVAVGLSNDAEGNLLAPAKEGQLRAMRAAYSCAEWDPAYVDLIECHATGTAIGDAVELQSLHELWREARFTPGQCVLGAVKSTIGHTLTAAGAAGLLKVLLAMRHETLPPTANFRRPRPELSLKNSPFRVLTAEEPWQRRPGQPRRAAVSAFGFGGTNAHLLLEEFIGNPTRISAAVQLRHADPEPVAVVGMDAHVGPCEHLAAFSECALGYREIPDCTLKSVSVGTNEFRIPPRDLEEALPQQLLMLQTAAGAMAQVRWDAGKDLVSGVFIGLGLDPNTTNFHLRWACLADGDFERANQMSPPLGPGRTLGALASITASRIAREFGLGGPSFTVSDSENSGVRVLHLACEALRRQEIDQAVVGAVDLTGDARTVRAFSLDKPADGAVSLVLKRLRDAERDGDEVLAVVREIGCPPSTETAPWVERLNPGEPLSPFGHLGAVTCLIAVARAVLALYQNILPARPARDWVWDMSDGPRRAAISCRITNQLPFTAVLEEADSVKRLLPAVASRPKTASGLLTVPIANRTVPKGRSGTAGEARRTEAAFRPVVLTQLQAAQSAKARAHDRYLQFSGNLMTMLGRLQQQQESLVAWNPSSDISLMEPEKRQAELTREQCLEFAVGSVGAVLGASFEKADHFPTRVRLPDEPLMLVDRVLRIEGEPCSLGRGNVVTEHDILPDAWYLDNGRVPAGIAVESGQADLLLSAYLGIDFRTRGLAVYRLLDATVTFHGSLPGAGAIIHHDIHIDEFFQHGETYFFRFRFESNVDGQPLMTMRDGCAGFFTTANLAAGKGLVRKAVDASPPPVVPDEPWRPLFTVAAAGYDGNQIDSLR